MLVQEYKLDNAKVWFIRMSLSARGNVMACGNTQGQVYVWDRHQLMEQPQAILTHNNAKFGKTAKSAAPSTVSPAAA